MTTTDPVVPALGNPPPGRPLTGVDITEAGAELQDALQLSAPLPVTFRRAGFWRWLG